MREQQLSLADLPLLVRESCNWLSSVRSSDDRSQVTHRLQVFGYVLADMQLALKQCTLQLRASKAAQKELQLPRLTAASECLELLEPQRRLLQEHLLSVPSDKLWQISGYLNSFAGDLGALSSAASAGALSKSANAEVYAEPQPEALLEPLPDLFKEQWRALRRASMLTTSIPQDDSTRQHSGQDARSTADAQSIMRDAHTQQLPDSTHELHPSTGARHSLNC